MMATMAKAKLTTRSIQVFEKILRDHRLSLGHKDKDPLVPDWAYGGSSMFTVEMDHDETTVTVLDNEGNWDDVELFLYDDVVYIRQFDEELNVMQMIAMSPQMFHELLTSMNHSVGAYVTHHK